MLYDLIATLFSASFLAAILRAATPLVYAALGGLVSELAGVINVGLEGIMLIAAFTGVAVSAGTAIVLPDAGPLVWAFSGFAAAIVSAMLLALVLAVLHLEFDANLIIAGVGINILAAGLTVFLLFAISGDKGSSAGMTSYALPEIKVGTIGTWPVIGPILGGPNGNGHNILIWGAFLATGLVWLVLHRTRAGLRLRAVGEHPEACRSIGLPVKKIRYGAILWSGLLAGIGGVYLSMGYLTLFQANMTAGRGFLALAAVFLGGRSVLGTAGAAAFFGLASVFAAQLGLLGVSTQVVYSVAPVVTILAMIGVSMTRRRRAKLKMRTALLQLQGKDSTDG